MILGCFQHAYLLNMDRHTERLAAATQRLNEIGIPFERFRSVDCDESSTSLNSAQIGCNQSHIAIVKQAKSLGYGSIMIFEDDVIFRPDFLTEWQKLQPQVKSTSYDLLFLYDWDDDDRPQERMLKKGGTWCTHAYAVSARYYDRFILRGEDLYDRLVIDTILRSDDKANRWLVSPSLAGQNAGASMLDGFAKRVRWSSKDVPGN